MTICKQTAMRHATTGCAANGKANVPDNIEEAADGPEKG